MVESRVSYPRLLLESCQAPTGRVGPATLPALYIEGLEGLVGKMANAPPPPKPDIDRYLVIHVATTCDEHGVYVTKDSAEVIEIGWLLLDAKNCEEVCRELLVWKISTNNNTDPPRERSGQASQHSNNSFMQ